MFRGGVCSLVAVDEGVVPEKCLPNRERQILRGIAAFHVKHVVALYSLSEQAGFLVIYRPRFVLGCRPHATSPFDDEVLLDDVSVPVLVNRVHHHTIAAGVRDDRTILAECVLYGIVLVPHQFLRRPCGWRRFSPLGVLGSDESCHADGKQQREKREKCRNLRVHVLPPCWLFVFDFVAVVTTPLAIIA